MGIGGALMIIAAVLKGVQICEYYHRTFTQIPNMIVGIIGATAVLLPKKKKEQEPAPAEA